MKKIIVSLLVAFMASCSMAIDTGLEYNFKNLKSPKWIVENGRVNMAFDTHGNSYTGAHLPLISLKDKGLEILNLNFGGAYENGAIKSQIEPYAFSSFGVRFDNIFIKIIGKGKNDLPILSTFELGGAILCDISTPFILHSYDFIPVIYIAVKF